MNDNKRTASKAVVVSGVQPSGRSHIGNFAGSYSNWLKLQQDPGLRCYFFIADYHSLTGNYDPKTKRQQVLDLSFAANGLGTLKVE